MKTETQSLAVPMTEHIFQHKISIATVFQLILGKMIHFTPNSTELACRLSDLNLRCSIYSIIYPITYYNFHITLNYSAEMIAVLVQWSR